MTSLYIPVGSGQYKHRFTLTGDPESMFVIAGFRSDDGDPGPLGDVAAGLHNAMATIWSGFGAAAYTLQETTLVFNNAGTEFEVSYVDPTSGGNNVTVVPQNTAYLVHKRTGLTGHRNRGRFYLPGVIESVVDNKGLVDGATVAAWNTALTGYLSDVAAVGGILGMSLLHTPSDDVPTPADTLINGLSLDPIVATQRRRLRP